MKTNNIATIIIVAVVVGALGFFAGTKYQQNQPSSQFAQFANRAGGGQFRFGNRSGMAPVAGQILSVDTTGITIKMRDGSTKIVIVPDNATISKATTGSKSDIKEGDQVLVLGTQNSDGSVTAQNVQLNPTMFRRGTTPTAQPTQ